MFRACNAVLMGYQGARIKRIIDGYYLESFTTFRNAENRKWLY
jgi:hypothetical protein